MSAGLCSGSTEDSEYANKNDISDQPVRCIAARGEIGGGRGENFCSLEPRLQKKKKAKEENRLDQILQG